MYLIFLLLKRNNKTIFLRLVFKCSIGAKQMYERKYSFFLECYDCQTYWDWTKFVLYYKGSQN